METRKVTPAENNFRACVRDRMNNFCPKCESYCPYGANAPKKLYLYGNLPSHWEIAAQCEIKACAAEKMEELTGENDLGCGWSEMNDYLNNQGEYEVKTCNWFNWDEVSFCERVQTMREHVNGMDIDGKMLSEKLENILKDLENIIYRLVENDDCFYCPKFNDNDQSCNSESGCIYR